MIIFHYWRWCEADDIDNVLWHLSLILPCESCHSVYMHYLPSACFSLMPFDLWIHLILVYLTLCIVDCGIFTVDIQNDVYNCIQVSAIITKISKISISLLMVIWMNWIDKNTPLHFYYYYFFILLLSMPRCTNGHEDTKLYNAVILPLVFDYKNRAFSLVEAFYCYWHI